MAAEPGSSFPSTRLSPDLIFLSFAGSDRARVEPIATALRAGGASVWYDAGSTAGGGNYVQSTQRALQRAGAMLVFVSATSTGSGWVAEELRAYRSLMARESGRKMLAIHLDRTRAPLALAGVDSIDARDAQPETVVSLIASALGSGTLISAQTSNATSARMPTVTPAAPAAAPQKPPAAQPPVSTLAPVASGQVFVSYARPDRERVLPLVEALRARGVTVWDGSELAHGSPGWVEAARGALDQSQTLLVAVSATSVASPWVADDVRAFQALKMRAPGRTLVAVHLDRTRAPLSLASAHAIDAQSLSPSDAANLIARALPAGGFDADAANAVVEPAAAATPAAVAVPMVEAAPVAVSENAFSPEKSATDGANMPVYAAPVDTPPVAQAVVAPPESVAVVVAEPSPEPAPAAAAPAPTPETPAAAPLEIAPTGMAETAPAPAVRPAAVVASPTLAEKAAEAKAVEAKKGGRAGEVVALLVVLLIAIAIAWAMSFL